MTDYFMSKIAVKKIIIVNQERFTPPGYKDPVEVRPVPLLALENMGDLSNKTMYIYPNPPADVRTGVFRIFLADR
jgi:hypothetical protein